MFDLNKTISFSGQDPGVVSPSNPDDNCERDPPRGTFNASTHTREIYFEGAEGVEIIITSPSSTAYDRNFDDDQTLRWCDNEDLVKPVYATVIVDNLDWGPTPKYQSLTMVVANFVELVAS